MNIYYLVHVPETIPDQKDSCFFGVEPEEWDFLKMPDLATKCAEQWFQKHPWDPHTHITVWARGEVLTQRVVRKVTYSVTDPYRILQDVFGKGSRGM